MTHEQHIPESILLKIQKVLALSKRTSSEAEANTAMERAHLLLAKHNLSMAQVEGYDASPIERIEYDRSAPATKHYTPWQADIYDAVSRLYFCKWYHTTEWCPVKKARLGRHVVIGRKSNIEIVHYVAQYLLRTCDQLATSGSLAAAKRLAADGIELNRRAWAGSFRLGFSRRISARVREEIAKAMSGEMRDDVGTALAIAPLYNQEKTAVSALMEKDNIKLSSGSNGVVRSGGAYSLGKQAGDEANLQSNGITAGAPKAAISNAGGA